MTMQRESVSASGLFGLCMDAKKMRNFLSGWGLIFCWVSFCKSLFPKKEQRESVKEKKIEIESIVYKWIGFFYLFILFIFISLSFFSPHGILGGMKMIFYFGC